MPRGSSTSRSSIDPWCTPTHSERRRKGAVDGRSFGREGPMTPEERIQVIEDRAAIMELIARYAMGVAHRDRDRVLACWAPDGVFDVGPVKVAGRDQIREFLKNLR